MSKKYVIEIKPEYEDTTKGVMVLGARESNLYVDTLSIEDLEELNSDYINEHYGELQDEAYQRGFDDAHRISGEEYQRGLNDAWEAARRIVVDTNHGGLALGTLSEIFGAQSYTYIMTENTAQEAIDKIKAYEHKDSDRIEVGDVIANNTEPGLKVWVTTINEMGFCGMAITDFGSVKKGELFDSYSTKGWHKTGRHFDIASILEAMRK